LKTRKEVRQAAHSIPVHFLGEEKSRIQESITMRKSKILLVTTAALALVLASCAAPTPTAAPTLPPPATTAPPATLVPDFTQMGFPTVIGSVSFTPGTATSVAGQVPNESSASINVDIPADAFSTPVKFEILWGPVNSFAPRAPSGQSPIFDFAFRVTDTQTGALIEKFDKPVTAMIMDPMISSGSMYFNIAPDGTYTANPTGMQVKAGELDHPVAGSSVGWVVAAPATVAPSPTPGYSMTTPEEAALAAAGGQKIGGTVTVIGEWGGSEQDSFMSMLKPFEDATGVQVQYTGTRDVPAILTTRVTGGNPPDLADIPSPGILTNYASQGKLVDLSTVLDMSTFNSQYAKTWADLGSYNGSLYGLFMKAAVKGLIWYDPKVFQANGYQIPKTWDDLMALSQKIAASGTTPWCVAVESGSASGWPGTDWLEDIVLRQAGEQAYNQWWQGTLKWTSPEIKQAWQTWGQIVGDPKMTFGGADRMLTTNFGNVGDPLFTSPPGCDLVHQASFIADFFTQNTPGVKPITDFNWFPVPPFNSTAPLSTEMGGDAIIMFNKTPQSEALMRYLATPEAQAIWAKIGGGYLSPNKDVPLSTYPDELSRKAAGLLTSVQVAVFDASDNMPQAMQAAFYKAVLDYIQNPSDLDSILQNLDSVQQSAYHK
jgi:alpha-glucoside transport system substrate-binding protein